MTGEEDKGKPTTKELRALIEDEFAGVEVSVSAEHVARLYGIMATQTDAITAVYALVMKAAPNLLFSDERIALEKAMSTQLQALRDGLISLSKRYGKTESEDE